MSPLERAVRISRGLLRVALVTAVLLAGVVVIPDRPVLAQVDPCSLLTIDEVEAVLGTTGTQADPMGPSCFWSGPTSAGQFVYVQLTADVVDAEQHQSTAAYDTVEVAGFPAFRYADSHQATIAVQLASSAPWISVITSAGLDTSAAAASLMEVVVRRLVPDADPDPTAPSPPAPSPAAPSATPAPSAPSPTTVPAAPTAEPSAPSPTSGAPVPTAPAPPAEPTPFVDPGECLGAIEAADLAEVASIDAVAACRFTHAGLEAARTALTSGGTRDQLWAAVWLYATWGTDPAPLLPILAADDPSIRAMAASALLRLGEPAALDVLSAAVTDDGILLGSLPPITISRYVQSILGRFVATDGALPSPGPDPGLAASGTAWQAWLDDHADQLVHDPATGGWSLP